MVSAPAFPCLVESVNSFRHAPGESRNERVNSSLLMIQNNTEKVDFKYSYAPKNSGYRR